MKMLDSSQKFFEMFLNGLQLQESVEVDCVSIRPISSSTYPDKYIKKAIRKDRHITYHYVPILNFPVIKSIFAYFSVSKTINKIIKTSVDEDIKIVCDPLLLEGLIPSIKIGKGNNIETTGFLTDMPNFANECDEHSKLKSMLYSVYNNKSDKYLHKLDKYIVLTEAMRCVANENPCLLIDCIVDEKMLKGLFPKAPKDGKPHILYAGKLHKEFGMDILGEAIKQVKSDCVFDLYGDGNYMNELKAIANERKNLCIHGIAPLQKVLQAELSSTILINPRTSQGEFTKYSFPSKTAEYMLSGVPVIMFKLPGISDEYDKYVSFVKNENPDGLAEEIDKVLQLNYKERKKIGSQARKFILENKNCVKIAKDILLFLRK